MTVIQSDPDEITSAWLDDMLEDFLQRDDVIGPAFFANIFLACPKQFEPMELETKWGASTLRAMQRTRTLRNLSGPYVVYENSLWQVLRLYDDVQKTFLITLQPELNNE